MHHIPCPHDRGSFASLVHVLGSLELHASPQPLRAKGARSATQLENTPKTELRRWIGPSSRQTVQQVRTREGRVRRPLQFALRVLWQRPTKSFRKTSSLRRQEAPENLGGSCGVRSRNSGIFPRFQSRSTSSTMWELFKQARYRSAAQNYGVAKSEHRSQGRLQTTGLCSSWVSACGALQSSSVLGGSWRAGGVVQGGMILCEHMSINTNTEV